MLKIAGAILSIYMSLFAIVGFAVFKAGVAIVDVKDKNDGDRVFVPVPVGLITAGMNLIPDHTLIALNTKVGPHQKYIHAAASELADCPDGVFVEVEGRDQHVLIEKRGGNLVIEAESPDDSVYVRIPIRSTGKLVAKLSAYAEKD
jgi:hypothetical protein